MSAMAPVSPVVNQLEPSAGAQVTKSFTMWPITGQVVEGSHVDRNLEKNPIIGGVTAMVEPYSPNHPVEAKDVDDNVFVVDAAMKQSWAAVQAKGATGRTPSRAITAPLVGEANRLNIRHLQMIRLMPKLLGFPESYFHLHELFWEVPLPQLEARQPLRDVYKQQGPYDRYERVGDSPSVRRGKV